MQEERHIEVVSYYIEYYIVSNLGNVPYLLIWKESWKENRKKK